MDNRPTEIKKELKLNLEALSLLSGHDEIETAWKDFKKVVANVISIQKINKYRTWISNYGVDWYKEYYKDEGDKNKVNPVRLIADVWGNSDEIGFDCEEKNKEWGEYFDECDEEVKTDNGKNARVVRVLKSSYKNGYWEYWYPVKWGKNRWHENDHIKDDLIRKYRSKESSTGKLGEIIMEGCPQYGFDLLSFNFGQDSFCKEILEKFFGANVKDKRYCLYEMPDTEEDFTSATFFKKRKND